MLLVAHGLSQRTSATVATAAVVIPVVTRRSRLIMPVFHAPPDASIYVKLRPKDAYLAVSPAATDTTTLRLASTGLQTFWPHTQKRRRTRSEKSPAASARSGTENRGASASGSTASPRPSRRFFTVTPPPSGARSRTMPASLLIDLPRSTASEIGSVPLVPAVSSTRSGIFSSHVSAYATCVRSRRTSAA